MAIMVMVKLMNILQSGDNVTWLKRIIRMKRAIIVIHSRINGVKYS